MVVVYLVVALIGAAVAVFALQNLDPVVIRFLVWRLEGTPLAMVILLSIVTGVFLASLIGVVQHVKLRGRIRQLERTQTHLARTPEQPADPARATPPPR